MAAKSSPLGGTEVHMESAQGEYFERYLSGVTSISVV